MIAWSIIVLLIINDPAVHQSLCFFPYRLNVYKKPQVPHCLQPESRLTQAWVSAFPLSWTLVPFQHHPTLTPLGASFLHDQSTDAHILILLFQARINLVLVSRIATFSSVRSCGNWDCNHPHCPFLVVSLAMDRLASTFYNIKFHNVTCSWYVYFLASSPWNFGKSIQPVLAVPRDREPIHCSIWGEWDLRVPW